MTLRVGIKASVRIISGYVREFEAVKDDNETMSSKSDVIIACLKVLSAATGHTYHWKRFDLTDGKLYSGICRMRKDSDKFIRYENCAISDE